MKTLMEIWMNGQFVHHLFLGSVTDSFVVRKGESLHFIRLPEEREGLQCICQQGKEQNEKTK